MQLEFDESQNSEAAADGTQSMRCHLLDSTGSSNMGARVRSTDS